MLGVVPRVTRDSDGLDHVRMHEIPVATFAASIHELSMASGPLVIGIPYVALRNNQTLTLASFVTSRAAAPRRPPAHKIPQGRLAPIGDGFGFGSRADPANTTRAAIKKTAHFINLPFPLVVRREIAVRTIDRGSFPMGTWRIRNRQASAEYPKTPT